MSHNNPIRYLPHQSALKMHKTLENTNNKQNIYIQRIHIYACKIICIRSYNNNYSWKYFGR